MRFSFAEDRGLGEAVFDLLETVFPGLRGRAEDLRRLGATWESVSTPFVRIEEGRPVAHIGVIELPLILCGRPVTVGSVHAVATHPRYRRRGFYRSLLEEVIRDSAGRFETLVLTTDRPALYEPFGFRVLREHLFTLRVPPRAPGNPCGTRLLDLQDPADLAILCRLLDTREPVSRVVGVTGAKAVFLFNEGRRPLHYAEDMDAVISMEREGGTLRIFDVVGARIPSVEEILARVPEPVEEVAFAFATDRIAPDAVATPHLLDHDGPSYLMARGPFPAEGEPFTLPRPART